MITLYCKLCFIYTLIQNKNLKKTFTKKTIFDSTKKCNIRLKTIP